MTASLVLVCSNYPFTGRPGEVMFVAPEVRRLADVFGRVVVAPQHARGEALPLPAGVELDLGLADALRRGGLLAYLWAPFWPGFGTELWRALRQGGLSGCARVWRWAAFAQVTWRWARSRAAADEPTVFVTYWRGGCTLALARRAAVQPHTAAVSRVHGHELYAERWRPPFQPWLSMYRDLALVVPISKHGLDYLLAEGVSSERLWLSRLGTEAAVPARASEDGRLRVVSCSAMVPLKRVPLIAQSLQALARRHPALQLHWTHFGDGTDMPSVRDELRGRADNFHVRLPGHVDNAIVLAHYASQPVDLFILLSEAEGLPVSIQEACAAGIPVLATDVGGVSEIVGSDNGHLLPVSPTPDEVASTVHRLCVEASFAARRQMREQARARWSADFNAQSNHRRYARRLRELMNPL
ncbi:MAG: glycosyltransferase [Burkholderiaceae bacterium]|nr:glycosyltransferase [Burkholderiaceae bacterium]